MPFSKIKGIKLGGVATSKIGVSSDVTNDPYPIFWGEDSSGNYLEYGVLNTPSIQKLLIKVKKKHPNIQIDENFSKYISLMYHKKLFGKYNKERLFLLTVLLLGVFFVPLILLILDFLKNT